METGVQLHLRKENTTIMKHGSLLDSKASVVGVLAIALCLSPLAAAQDRDRDRGDRDRDRNAYGDRMTRLEPGTVIPVRINDGIDADRRDNRVYTGIVDQDV